MKMQELINKEWLRTKNNLAQNLANEQKIGIEEAQVMVAIGTIGAATQMLGRFIKTNVNDPFMAAELEFIASELQDSLETLDGYFFFEND